MVGKMTLDRACERFEAAPHLPENMATLLLQAQRYWQDGIISDDTFAAYVAKARKWISQVPIRN